MSQYKNLLDELNQSMQVNHSYSKEPNWMVKIVGGGGKVLTNSDSTLKPAGLTKESKEHLLNQFSYIYDHQFALTRGFAKESSTNSITPDDGLTAHELKIVAPSAAVHSAVHEHFSQNVLLTSIHLIRIVNIDSKTSGSSVHVTSEYIFSDAYISGLISQGDLICLAFRYAGITYTKKALDPLSATAKGSTVTAYHNVVTGSTSTPK